MCSYWGISCHRRRLDDGARERASAEQRLLDVCFVNPSPVFYLDKLGIAVILRCSLCLFCLTPDKDAPMPVPFAPPVTLADDERSQLESLVRAHSTPQALAFRCRLILRARRPTTRPICGWPPRWPVSAIPSAVGVSAISRTASRACKMRRARVARGAFPPSERVDVLSMATQKPATYHCPATRWSLDDLVAALHQHRRRGP